MKLYCFARPSFIFLFFSSLAIFGCGQKIKKNNKADSPAKDWDQTIPGNFIEQKKAVFDSIQITAFFDKYHDIKIYERQVRDFYHKRNYAFAWFDDGRLIEQAGNLSNRISNLQNDGVYKKIMYQNELDSLLDEDNEKTNIKQPGVILEIMLTSQYFAFSKLAWQGMDVATSIDTKWYVPRKKVAYEAYLDSILKAPAKLLMADKPVYRQYELLKSFLRKYRALADSKTWDPIVNSKKPLKLGDTAVVISQIKSRLYKLTDFSGDTSDRSYNNELISALKQFQERNGLNGDGLLNKETIATLNVPLRVRIEQILVNMERSRWLPVSLDSDYLAVNIPEFKLHVYHADSLLWSCNVVVGQTVHQTTVFYGQIKYVVFSPYWNVPESIVRKEIIPGMNRDKNYLTRHGMEITGRLDGLPVVRQKPGPMNSLGLVKFLFPNSYNIYLHDTPSQSLFGETSRDFSHGCIRVMEPVKLAGFLLKNNDEWNSANIKEAMHSGKEQYVTIKKKVPVFIAYFTAFVDRDNKLNFRKDIYKLDEHLASMIILGKGV